MTDDFRGPIETSPDRKKARERYEKVPGPLKKAYRYIFVPAQVPTAYSNEAFDDLAARLQSSDAEVTELVLDEAKEIYKEPRERIDSAERRATTLQGTVAIAASVAAAGGGLLLDPTRVKGEEWRVGFGILLALFVVCLVVCGIRALGATSRTFVFQNPGVDRIPERAQMTDPNAVMGQQAAELMRAFAVADEVGSVKVGLLNSATWWFRWAIIVLAALAIFIGSYAIWGPEAPGTDKGTGTQQVGPTGPAGAQGVPGRQGEPGPQGPRGPADDG
jgi:hypothetical protein